MKKTTTTLPLFFFMGLILFAGTVSNSQSYAETVDNTVLDLFSTSEINVSDMTSTLQSKYDSYKQLEHVSDISNILQAQLDVLESNTIILNFFGDSIKVSKDKVTIREENDYTWYGTVQNQDPSSIILVVKNDKITGMINTIQKQYSIVPLENSLHVVLDIDSTKYPKEHPPEYSVIESESAAKFADLVLSDEYDANRSTQDSYQVVTTLVAYTPAARDSTTDISSLIQLAVDETNQGYQNSDIPITLELVHTQQVDYIETDFSTDRNRLMAVDDGYMDEIHDLRDIHAADVVILIVDNPPYCGLAAAILAEENEAFGLVHWSCATGNYTFAHEIGHLQGARHNPEADSTTIPFEHGHGFFYEPDSWRTIMSYNCPSGCTRIDYWSNPDVQFGEVAMGTTHTHDNARVLSETANDIASFRVEFPKCVFPTSGDWIITSSCTVQNNTIANNGKIIVQNNSVLTIPNGITLDVDLVNHNLQVQQGSGILIESGGTVR